MRLLITTFLFFSARGARIAFFSDSSCATPAQPFSALAYTGLCTDVGLSYGLGLAQCAQGVSATALMYFDTRPSMPILRPPTCGAPSGPVATLQGALGVCSPVPPAIFPWMDGGAGAAYWRWDELSCAPPPASTPLVYLGVPRNRTCDNVPAPSELYSLFMADNTCQAWGSALIAGGYYRYRPAYSASASTLSISLYSPSDPSCSAAAIAAWPALPLPAATSTCALDATSTVGLRALSPLPAYTPPAPSASPAPAQPPAVEQVVLVNVYGAPPCTGAPSIGQLRALPGLCTANAMGLDVGLSACTVGGGATISLYNQSSGAAGRCAGDILGAAGATFGGCSPFYPAFSAPYPVYVSLAQPPASCAPLNAVSAGSAMYYAAPSCAGAPVLAATHQFTGGPGTCMVTGAYSYSASLNSASVPATFSVDSFASTGAVSGCSGAGSIFGGATPLVTVTDAPATGACAPALYGGGFAQWSVRAWPATSFPPPPASAPLSVTLQGCVFWQARCGAPLC